MRKLTWKFSLRSRRFLWGRYRGGLILAAENLVARVFTQRPCGEMDGSGSEEGKERV